MLQAVSVLFDQTDFSVVVKKPRAASGTVEMGDSSSKQHDVLYDAVEAANRAGIKVLKQLFTDGKCGEAKFFVED
jgi:hypothetical protein